ncbi:MAG: 30S ribosomal protein S6 [Armatimonadetes bacterium]|nr:30S ribosomal protein S6 [Armatimonadota bacterium]
MREYEAVYILNPQMKEEEENQLVEKFSQQIVTMGGEVVNIEHWGEKKLAYEVKRNKEGRYVLMHFKGQSAAVKELERIFKIQDEVLRYTVVRLN